MHERKSGRRGLGVVGAVLVLASAFTILTASPASAGRPPTNSGNLCVWEHEHWGGEKYCMEEAFLNSVSGFTLPAWFDDRASSISNQTGITICFYVGARGLSGYEALGSGHWLEYLTRNPSPNGGSWNDKISSVSKTPCRGW